VGADAYSLGAPQALNATIMNKHGRAITASVRIWSALAGDMSYATSLAGLTTMALQGRIEVFDQYLSVERLTQEAGCSGFQRLRH
jgi:hypothetical protein